MSRGHKRRSQPRIPGLRRIPRHSGLLPELDRKVKQLAIEHDVSPSWVVATLLADALHIDTQPDYRRRPR